MINELFSVIGSNLEKYTEFLKDICCFETPTREKQDVDKMVDFISDFAKSEGFSVKRTRFEKCGDFLTVDINEGNEKGHVFLAHMDTVHKKGAFGYPPAKYDGEKLIGPGTIDCKGGIAISLLAMKALMECGFEKHTRLILTSDEEISNVLGGQAEMDFFESTTKGFKSALNCETTRGNEVVVSRKGIIRLEMEIHGKGGHSGIDYFNCKSAVREAAYKIVELEKNSKVGGTTYNCGVINGGTVANIIPEKCNLIVDVRVVDLESFDGAFEFVKKIAETDFTGGTSTELRLVSRRLPMMYNDDTRKLFDKMQKISLKYDLGELVPEMSGGGSDSAYTQKFGVPSLCGLGGSGDFFHTDKEYINLYSIEQRAKLLSAFCAEY